MLGLRENVPNPRDVSSSYSLSLLPLGCVVNDVSTSLVYSNAIDPELNAYITIKILD